MKIIIKVFCLFFLMGFFIFSHLACSHSNSSSLPMQTLKIQKVDSSSVALQVEIADSDEERMQGLMFRTSLSENQGMLFIFEQDTANPFWMKNTPLPLDIIFINAQKKVVSIAPNTTPFSETLIYSESAPYRFALEVNAGFAKSHGIQIGDIIIF